MPEGSPRDILSDHLRRREDGDLEGDLTRNYRADIVQLCKDGDFFGLDAIRQSAAQLGRQVLNARFEYLSCQIHEEHGLLEWRAESDMTRIDDGVDSYVLRDGRIRVQTIHYTVTDRQERSG